MVYQHIHIDSILSQITSCPVENSGETVKGRSGDNVHA